MSDIARTIGWGFIGASTIAREHMIGAVRAQPGHDVVAVASGDAAHAQRFAVANGIAGAYGSVDALLADPAVQVVYISSTNDRHHPQALAAMVAGKAVLCEKPLALSVEEAHGMIDAAQRANVLFATNHHLRNAATHRMLREVVRSGRIGKPLFARVFHAIWLRELVQGWRIERPGAGGGVILDIGTHDVDALRFILGSEVAEVVGMSQQGPLSKNGVEDGVMAVLRMSDGVLAQVHAAYTVRHAPTGLEIHGDAGSVVASESMTTRPAGTVLVRTAAGEELLPIEHESLYVRGVRCFCAALEGRGQPAADGLDGLRSLEASIAIAEACRTGRAITISRMRPHAF